ncbi:MAG: hypothetical protein O4861_15840 [Trichodesmium sp. St16_bin4-tuft]|nr:hypothetical protein [Trichodesmium sp. St5_bin8]MDE5079538.1 hypothetical protein [Trichodesmium sp. St2_bin6]MDE5091264.1 hypothetical protein [Trichodesmium sp. St18_bin3_1_1]MDE5093186.1 hypothetical protein [Trichodesmium sp. St11_bin5]MDE5099722.1 hypothetical protein [Trichodesmium sp. St16_bin4-tuft]
MKTANFLTWLICIRSITSINIGAMIYAYRGQESISVLFTKSRSSQAEAKVKF